MIHTVLVITNYGGEILKTFLFPTGKLSEKDQQDIKMLAAKYNQLAKFEVIGVTGVENAKWEIKEMNGDTAEPA